MSPLAAPFARSGVVEWIEHGESPTSEADDGFATARPIPAIGRQLMAKQ
jgi:hypothetical protein